MRFTLEILRVRYGPALMPIAGVRWSSLRHPLDTAGAFSELSHILVTPQVIKSTVPDATFRSTVLQALDLDRTAPLRFSPNSSGSDFVILYGPRY